MLSEELLQSRYALLIQNTDLQLIILYYFLYMLQGKLMLHINMTIAFLVTGYYIYQGVYETVFNYVIAVVAIGCIYLCCRVTLQLKEKALNNRALYFLLTLLYGMAWGLKIFPALNYRLLWLGYYLLNFFVLMLLVRAINRLVRRQLKRFDNLSFEAKNDFLSGIGNRLSFDREFSHRFALSDSKKSLAFAMIDIDHFKRINDEYGHATGDLIIKNVAHAIRRTLFKYQLENQVFRIGGEEFGILFQEKSQQDITEILKAISQEINKLSLNVKGQEVRVTISAGVSRCRESDVNKEELYKRADDYLYIAKKEGRNAIYTDEKVQQTSSPAEDG